MFTKDGICTLVDVVIVNLVQVNLLPQSCATQGFVAFDVVQSKEKSHRDRHPTDQFLPLTVQVFDVYINKPMCFYMIVPMPFGV